MGHFLASYSTFICPLLVGVLDRFLVFQFYFIFLTPVQLFRAKLQINGLVEQCFLKLKILVSAEPIELYYLICAFDINISGLHI